MLFVTFRYVKFERLYTLSNERVRTALSAAPCQKIRTAAFLGFSFGRAAVA
ncbi:hypothetical protein [Shimia sp.]|uniref:hypothetical protein n=1 Tax=Shimia sp. TaxID=1954381 RepID=UPI003BA85BC9